MIRLFCVPYAGGSALVYKPWIADFQRQGIELIPLEMKGRGSRITESFYADFEEAKEDLLQMIYQYLEESDHPFAFLGVWGVCWPMNWLFRFPRKDLSPLIFFFLAVSLHIQDGTITRIIIVPISC